jgi:large subunit ribosomal protein L25
MERIAMTAEKRELGKGPARRLRVAGKVPAVLYGKSAEPRAIAVNSREVEALMKKAAASGVLVDLTVEGETNTALIRDYQADPFKRFVTHVDFQAVGLDEKIEVEVPIRLNGEPKGIKEGGILEQLRRSINIRCVASNIPAHIDVDVSELMIGDNIHVDDISLGEGIEFPHTANFTIAAVVPPTKEEEVAPPAAEVPEGEEAAPAEGEAAPAEGAAEEKPAEGGEEKKEE